MIIHKYSRVWWPQTITALDLNGDEVVIDIANTYASFDAGVTWVPARDNAGKAGWLIADASFLPSNDPLTDFTMGSTRVRPIIKLEDAPEILTNDDYWLIPGS